MTFSYLSEAHFVSENAILALRPQVCEPVQPCKLELFELSTRGLNVIWVRLDLHEVRSLVSGIVRAPEREPALLFAFIEGINLVLRNALDFVNDLPRAVVLRKPGPFAEIFDITGGLTHSNATFNRLVQLEVLPFAFLVEQKGFGIFTTEIRIRKTGFVLLIAFNVIVDTFKTLKALQELVILVGIMQMREVLPFDMETLQRMSS